MELGAGLGGRGCGETEHSFDVTFSVASVYHHPFKYLRLYLYLSLNPSMKGHDMIANIPTYPAICFHASHAEINECTRNVCPCVARRTPSRDELSINLSEKSPPQVNEDMVYKLFITLLSYFKIVTY